MVSLTAGTIGSKSSATCAYAGNASADVLPVANTLQFITNAVQQSFVLSVLPDDVPELDEVS